MTTQEEIAQLETQLQAAAGQAGLKEQAEVILEILEKYELINSREGEIYIQKLNQIGDELNNDIYRAWGHYYKGNHNRLSDNYKDALDDTSMAVTLFSLVSNPKGLARSYTNSGIVHSLQGNCSEALSNNLASLKIWEEIGDKKGIASSYNNIGAIYFAQGNYPEALSNFRASQKIWEQIGNKKGLAGSYHNTGNVYFVQCNYPEALSNHLVALKIKEEIGDKKGMAHSYTSVGIIYHEQGNYSEALSNHLASLKIKEEIGDKNGIAASFGNIGNVYSEQRNYFEALSNLRASLKIKEEIGDKNGIAISYDIIGKIYFAQGNYPDALSNHMASLKIKEEIGDKYGLAFSYNNIGNVYNSLKKYGKASENLAKGHLIAEEVGAKSVVKDSLKGWYQLKKAEGDGMAALEYHEKFVALDKELQNEETSKKIAGLQFGYQIEKKEQEVVFERKKKEEVQVAYNLLEKEKERSESLLLNILPGEVAEELKEKGSAEAKLFDDVTVLFTDFKDFTKLSERLTPEELVAELNHCFKAFDEIITKYNIEKIKTIGDAYMAVSGLPTVNPEHAEDAIKAAFEMRNFILNRRAKLGDNTFEMRTGLHSGKVVAGIVGVKKYAYDIWGNTVNTAARMEQTCEPGKVNISETTYRLVKDKFQCTHRGKIAAKNIGEIDMYFVEE